MRIARNNGFTLIELMVTLAVVAVLLSAGIPSFATMIKNNRLVSENYALRTVLSAARSEAQTQRTTVTVCRTINGVDCSPGDWNAGYMAFIDLDGDDTLDNGEQLIQSREQGMNGIALAYTEDNLQFDGNGNALGSSGTFTFCDDRGAEKARGLIVTPIGSVRAAVESHAEDSTHIVQDHDGDDVTCG